MDLINKWKDKIAHYIDVRVQLVRLEFIERTSGVLSYLIFVFICLFISVSVLMLLGIVFGEMFADLMDSRALGYLTIAGIYILLLVLIVALRKPITNSFSGMFIRVLTDANDDDDDDDDDDKERNKKLG